MNSAGGSAKAGTNVSPHGESLFRGWIRLQPPSDRHELKHGNLHSVLNAGRPASYGVARRHRAASKARHKRRNRQIFLRSETATRHAAPTNRPNQIALTAVNYRSETQRQDMRWQRTGEFHGAPHARRDEPNCDDCASPESEQKGCAEATIESAGGPAQYSHGTNPVAYTDRRRAESSTARITWRVFSSRARLRGCGIPLGGASRRYDWRCDGILRSLG
jgi:hypothetical protein